MFMKKFIISTLVLVAIAITVNAQTTAIDTTGCAEVELTTTEGTIRLRLYNETPLHRDNFLKLVKEHTYDSVLFHRVIADFMIQAGAPFSKNAKPGELVGEGTLDYTVPAEIRLPAIYHKRGALAAARENDDVNPERRSDACQFYIVWGRTQKKKEIAKQQQRIDKLFNDRIKFSEEATANYTNIGGTPHLDGWYTVFGEVTEGLDVVDRIQSAATDTNDRPLTDIWILHATVVREPQQQTKVQ